MLYNVTWATSKTKEIYNATRESEELMAYLETKIVSSNLVELIGEKPVPEKGREYGVMIYYYQSIPNRRLLSAAPRKENDHIHVVLFGGILNRKELVEKGFEIGNGTDPQPDIKMRSKDEINILTELLKKNLRRI
ncbi:hypothetical protein [Gracilibacillus thailandensis]|uniref:DUF1801 domain-containing protein n=1 Tax=Gracilibacillus thailandensis TaxID=563735 RepID=A0A6N7QWY2_9BACI|nr:hypothetical protein [Gracilibacillus thailandensis]MRI66623.1 hypothetical protein [Gracilibacillus thailandensis]